MRLVLASLLVLSLAAVAGCDLEVADKGYFNLKNGTDKTIDILVSDNDQCVIGLNSSVAYITWRNYDIEKKDEGAWLCIDKQPHKVVNGKSYLWDDGKLVETEAPQ